MTEKYREENSYGLIGDIAGTYYVVAAKQTTVTNCTFTGSIIYCGQPFASQLVGGRHADSLPENDFKLIVN